MYLIIELQGWMYSKLFVQTFTSTKEVLCYLSSLPPESYLTSLIGLVVETGPETMALAGFDQDV